MRHALGFGGFVVAGALASGVVGCADLLGFKTFAQDQVDGGLAESGAPSTQGGNESEGGAVEACGADGCGPGRKCENAVCVCDPATCAGCCSGSACSTGWPGCGAGGGACNACDDTSDRCDANGGCACGSHAACASGQRCVGGGCTCDATSCVGGTCCGDVCVKTDDDGANCGACGHSCLGAACNGGHCVPTTVASTGDPGWALHLDGANLYWIGPKGIYGSPTKGPDATSFGPAATGFTFAQTNTITYFNETGSGPVLWASAGDPANQGNQAVITAKGDGSSAVSYQPITLITGWTVDSSGQFYWFADGNVSKRGYVNKLIEVIISGLTAGVAVEADANNVYVSDSENVWACPRATLQCGSSPTLISATGSPNQLATVPDSQFIYSSNHKGLYRCPYRGCADPNNVPIFANSQGQIENMATDASYIYWTDSGNGNVMRCPHGDVCVKPEVVVAGLAKPYGIAVDASWIYFTLAGATGANGPTVQRVAK